MSAHIAFDAGPLSWVKPEIDHALERCRQCLDRFCANPGDTAEIRAAQAHLHQVKGALQVVILEAAARFCEEVERLLQVLADPQRVPTKTQLSLVLRAVATLGQYLDDLMAGEPNLPLALMPLFRELSAVQGVAQVSESELFYPDLRVRPPRHTAGNPLSDRDLPTLVKVQRSRFQRGMLGWLKNDESGLPAMREALAAVERAQPLPHQRGFWWAGVGLMDALIAKGLANSVSVKKLCARIEQQMRAVGEGTILVSERLLRDVLFHIARAEPVTERVSEIKQLYRLDQYLASPRQAPRVELDRVQPILREVRELLRVAKDAWVKYSSGNNDTLSAFRDYVAKLDATVRQLGEPTLARLTQMVQRAAAVLPTELTERGEEVFLEMATALLVAEGAVERYGRPSPQLAAQVDAISARLAAALGPTRPSQPLPEVSLLDEVGRKAQEKMLAAQVVNEIQSNLREIEQVLDSFFREPEKRSALPQLKPIIRQVLGALNVMGQDTATKLLAECAATIERCSAADHKSTQQELELLADGLSSLSLYIDALKQNQTMDARMIEMVLARFTPGAQPVQPEPEEAPRRTLEAALEEEKLNAHQLLNTWHLRPDDAAVKRELKQSLEILHQGATLVENRQLLERTEAALTQLKAADLGPDASFKQAISTITGFLPPGIAPAAELAAAGKEAIDKELLSTYLEEAQEVLKNVHEQLAVCRAEPHNLDALTTIRRGFHTLKGSGRMVGLTELGEAAWGVEQVMIQWLQLERNATALLLEYLSLAHAYFHGWVGALSQHGWVQVDAARLMQLAEQVKASVESHAEPPQPAPIQEQKLGIEAAPSQPPAESVVVIESAETPEEGASDDATTVVGGARIPCNLLSLYIDEAGKHLDTLKQEFNTWRGQPAQAPTQEFMRAAHTLSGISRTTAFFSIAELGSALEQWVIELTRDPFNPGLTSVLSIEGAIQKLQAMVASVKAGREPEVAERAQHQLNLLLKLATEKKTRSGVTAELPKQVGAEHGNSVEVAPALAAPQPPPDASPQKGRAESVVQPRVAPPPRNPQPVEPPIAATQLWRMGVPQAPERRGVRDDLDEQLLLVFLEEAQELLPLVGEDLRRWRAQPDDASASQSLRRTLHTLKGSARMVGAMRLGELVHAMENEVVECIDAGRFDSAMCAKLEAQFDRLSEVLEALEHRGLQAVRPKPAEAAQAPVESAQESAPSAPQSALRASEPAEAGPTRAFIRVRAELVDELVNQAGEVSIARSRIESEIRVFKQALTELTDSTTRLRKQLREMEIQAESQLKSRLNQLSEQDQQFDPLEFDRYTRLQELTRLMAESVHDVVTVQHNLLNSLNETDAALLAQSRMNRHLQDDLMRVRSVPFSLLSERLYRVVRQAAKELDKKVNLDVVGSQIEVDRSVLEKVAAPLEHLLRNALIHGIEKPEDRLAAGKSEFGQIAVTLRQDPNELVLTVSDDGGGLDYARIRDKALQMELVRAEDDPTRTQFAQLIFNPGFSTAQQLSELAGRGIGMDVVKSDVQAVGGRIDLDSEPGRGTVFTLHLPLTLAVTHAVMIRAGGRIFGIPSGVVEQVQEYKGPALSALYASGEVYWLKNRYPLHYLPRVLGDFASRAEAKPHNSVILLKSGETRLAAHVDEVMRNGEVVLKPLGPQLAGVPGILGATVLPTGQAVLIVNPVHLAEMDLTVTRYTDSFGAEAPVAPDMSPTVLVVDDSLTVRKITSRLLSRQGYEVITAKDGVDALQQLQEIVPDVMLLDIEMPRMDGFELLKNVRGDARTAHTPIIMITSRTADKHRNYALELGANLFLGKPYQEELLLSHIAAFTGRVDPTQVGIGFASHVESAASLH